jgi:hypothetical protein
MAEFSGSVHAFGDAPNIAPFGGTVAGVTAIAGA